MKTTDRSTKLVPSFSALVLATALLPTGLVGCGGLDQGSADSQLSTTSSALQIGSDPAKSLDYIQCASENGTCVLGSSAKYVAFGAQGQFLYKSLSGNVPCTKDTFGGDPAVNVTKACYYANYTFVVSENGTDNHIRHEIAYGANGSFYFKNVSGTWSCNNATFGDPISGPTKACYEALHEYVQAANENQTLTGLNKTPVAYGAHGAYLFKVLTGTASCTTSTFGTSDPAVGVSKICYKFPYNWIADENGSFSFSTFSTIYYGTGLDGKFIAKTVAPQTGFQCTNATFGADPSPGPTKHCYIANAQ
ncbi:MAG TPA: hypothetical protein VN962_23165 [Polyangia bacterium]|nr:hypothetical protein [Polyangia bacterium]